MITDVRNGVGVGQHRARAKLLPFRGRPRYRFVVAMSGIVGLVFAVTATAAAISPRNRHDGTAGLAGTATANPPQPVGTSPTSLAATTAVTPSAQQTPSQPPTSPPEPTSTAPAPAGRVLGAYQVAQEWPDGFIGAIQLSNDSGTASAWQVRLEFPRTVYDLQKHWIAGGPGGATVTRTDQTVIFASEDPLAARATIELNFQFVKEGTNFDPTECWVNGRMCS